MKINFNFYALDFPSGIFLISILFVLRSTGEIKKKQMNSENPKTIKRIYAMIFGNVYPFYIQKAERKGRTKSDVDEIICWLTGYTKKGLDTQIKKGVTFKNFFAKAPKMNPSRNLITGSICGVKLEEIKDPLMKEIRYLDKLVDELAKGKSMEKILNRSGSR